MRVPLPVLVPYRTTAGHHGLRIMDRSLNPKINVRFMDRSLNACKSFHSKNNVRFMDRSLNACKTFHNRNQCSIYRTLIHRRKSKITFNVQFACTEL